MSGRAPRCSVAPRPWPRAVGGPAALLELAPPSNGGWLLSGLRPVQGIVIVSSCVLALLLFYFLAREVYTLVRKAAQRGSRRCRKIGSSSSWVRAKREMRSLPRSIA